MKEILVLIGILAIPMSVNAAMFKCTDTDGKVGFSDKPCPEQQQEILKEPAVSKPPEASPETGDAAATDDAATTETEPAETAATGAQFVTDDSPLAAVYRNFLAALKKCDRGEMLKYGSVKIAKDLARMTDTDLKNQCAQLQNFMPNDFTGATEVIDGNKGTIQWGNEASSTGESGPSTMKSMYTVNFTQEDGAWKYGE